MSTLFLDFDGVLNSMRWRKKIPGGWNKLDREAVARINRVVERTGCDVVVSSSWRLFNGEESRIPRLARILKENGASFDVVGVTPYATPCPVDCEFRPSTAVVRDPMDSLSYCARGHEIEAYLAGSIGDAARPPRGPFAIIDDSGDMGALGARHVQTRDHFGIQDHHVVALIHLLTDGS